MSLRALFLLLLSMFASFAVVIVLMLAIMSSPEPTSRRTRVRGQLYGLPVGRAFGAHLEEHPGGVVKAPMPPGVPP